MSDVAKPAYLDKRKGSSAWYYRRRYPSDIAKRLGRKEFVKSLKTSNYAEALKLLPAAEAAYLASLVGPSTSTGIVRHAAWPVRNLDPNLSELTEDMVPVLAAQHFERRRQELFLEPISFRRSEEHEQDLAEVEWRLHTLANPEDPDACRWTEAEEVALLNSNGLRADASGPASQMLRRHLWHAMVELEKLRRSRLNGHVTEPVGHPNDAGRNVAGSGGKFVARGATPLSKVIKLYRDEHLSTDDLAAKTVAKTEAALAMISRYFKASTPVAAIDRDACYAFRDMLAKLPPNFTKKHGSSSDLSKVAQKNATTGRSGLNKQTQEPYLRTLRRLLTLAKDRRFIAENPAEGIKPKGRAVPNEHKRNSYSKAQLTQLFNAPIYTGCQDDERNFAVPGPNKPRRSRFWVPLIALFTGLRLEEILQLTSEHVFNDESGQPYLRITRDMKVKSNNAYRAVPIHSELIKIGFMSLVAEASSREGHLLIVDVPHASDKTRSSVFSKRYSTFQKSLKMEEPGRKVTFHSFRHTFRDALRLPEANPDLVKELGGWSRGSETSTAYGDGARPEVLRTLIEQIDYRLDLSHLHATD